MPSKKILFDYYNIRIVNQSIPIIQMVEIVPLFLPDLMCKEHYKHCRHYKDATKLNNLRFLLHCYSVILK